MIGFTRLHGSAFTIIKDPLDKQRMGAMELSMYSECLLADPGKSMDWSRTVPNMKAERYSLR